MDSTDSIEIIIGADLYPQLIEEGIRKASDNGIIAQATGLGWILTGAVSTASSDPATVSSLSCHVDLDLAALLTRFWQQEEVLNTSATLSKDERDCENHFVTTHKRLADGRYVLRLPFKPNIDNLGNSQEAALRALLRTENRFIRQPEFQAKYDKFMSEYRSLGHMKELSPLESVSKDSSSFLLPHHGIFKTHGDVDKLRVVFNGSVKLPSGLPINECLHVGPKLQLDPFDVLLRWRVFRLAFSADIEKHFRRILIHEEDQAFQQILWRIGTIITVFNLCTVTYGLGPSPYQALRTLRQLVEDKGAKFPRAAQVLLDQIYVDDIFAGADTLEEALALKTEIVELLKAGGFPLSKWTANDPALLADVPETQQTGTQLLSWPEEQTLPMLGVAWHPLLDVFSFKFEFPASDENLTKRKALSMIAQLYDPVGWITPVTTSFKIFMQSLWCDGIGWDDPLPSTLRQRWLLLIDDLPHLHHFSVPRWAGSSSDTAFSEIHGFSDVSERAIAACLYLRTVSKEGNVQSILLASKSKVAPLKQVSLPRLELCGAVMLVRLMKRVRQTLCLENAQCFCWTDSTITIAWVKQPPVTWKTYVANRVSEIQTTLSNAVWLHVPGVENPADLPSRGILASDLVKSSMRIHGPAFLISSSTPWNSSSTCDLDESHETLERRSLSCFTVSAMPADPEVITRFSSLSRLVNTIARCLQFLQRAKSINWQATTFTPNCLLRALLGLVHWVQHIYFAEEISCLNKGVPLPRRSALIHLYPILDAQEYLRVGGRLRHSLLHPDERHPLILPQTSNLTKLLVLDAHSRRFTEARSSRSITSDSAFGFFVDDKSLNQQSSGVRVAGVNELSLPRSLWAICPSKELSNFDRSCTQAWTTRDPSICGSQKAEVRNPTKGIFASLFASPPVQYTSRQFRAAPQLTLNAYKRFTARRGVCASLTSDCGLNFIGADKELGLLFNQAGTQHTEIARLLATDGTEWRFNPPGAPHFGGLWEAAVKSVKFHLKRVIGEALLTFVEMTTLLAQIEACLNSRPLQPLSDDPEDLNSLTPGHFLIGEPTLTVPEPSLLDVAVPRLDRWQMLRHMHEQFWQRWSQEYLQHLQTRSKWHNKENPVKVGDLCLLRSELYPPCKWPLARITAVHPGQDGVVRVVEVKTASSSYTRPIAKISIMPQVDNISPVPGQGGRDVRKAKFSAIVFHAP